MVHHRKLTAGTWKWSLRKGDSFWEAIIFRFHVSFWGSTCHITSLSEWNPEIKVWTLFSHTKYVIPKSLKFSHWPSKSPKWSVFIIFRWFFCISLKIDRWPPVNSYSIHSAFLPRLQHQYANKVLEAKNSKCLETVGVIFGLEIHLGWSIDLNVAFHSTTWKTALACNVHQLETP